MAIPPPATTPIIPTSPNTPTLPPTQTSNPTPTTPAPPTTTTSSSPATTTTPSTSAQTSSNTSVTTTTTTSSSLPSTSPTTQSTTSTTSTLPAPATTAPPQPNVTVTSVSTSVPTSTGIAPATTGNQNNTSKGFFGNTGAVAGVFTVVGLVVVVFIVALITNAVRRRRAKKFDKELAEAAAVPAPVFLDDEGADPYNMRPAHHYNYASRRTAPDDGADAAYGQYSDVSSHGTYSQPPMAPHAGPGETYGMRELARGPSPGPGDVYGAYPNAQFAADAAAAGAAGIGVARARSARDPSGRGYASALQDGASPYAAFATPGYQNQLAHAHARSPPPLDAAGVAPQRQMSPPAAGGEALYNPHPAGSAGGDVRAVPATLVPGRARSPPVQKTSSPGGESYVSHYQTQNAVYGRSVGAAGESEEDWRGAYGGVKEDYDDENDGTSSGENGRRVLKVANE